MSNNVDPQELRRTFVSMLFALVVGHFAITTFSVLVEVKPDAIFSEINIASYLHLLLALFVITASWVEWSKTFTEQAYPKLDGLWSKGYLLLLLDIGILVLYFSMVKTVDAHSSDDNHSPVPESLIMFLIYSMYFVWDIFYSRETLSHRVVEVMPSLLFAIASFVVFYNFSLGNEGFSWLVGIDIILISLVFLFRLAKRCQIDIANKLRGS